MNDESENYGGRQQNRVKFSRKKSEIGFSNFLVGVVCSSSSSSFCLLADALLLFDHLEQGLMAKRNGASLKKVLQVSDESSNRTGSVSDFGSVMEKWV